MQRSFTVVAKIYTLYVSQNVHFFLSNTQLNSRFDHEIFDGFADVWIIHLKYNVLILVDVGVPF